MISKADSRRLHAYIASVWDYVPIPTAIFIEGSTEDYNDSAALHLLGLRWDDYEFRYFGPEMHEDFVDETLSYYFTGALYKVVIGEEFSVLYDMIYEVHRRLGRLFDGHSLEQALSVRKLCKMLLSDYDEIAKVQKSAPMDSDRRKSQIAAIIEKLSQRIEALEKPGLDPETA